MDGDDDGDDGDDEAPREVVAGLVVVGLVCVVELVMSVRWLLGY